MINKPKMLCLIAAIVALTLCCTADKKETKIAAENVTIIDSDVRIIGQNESGKNISLSRGQNLVLNLEANPSTGYRWEIVENNNDLLPLIGREFQQKEAPPGKVGVGGTLIMTFKAIEKGNTKLKLEYSKPQASENDIVKFFEINVKIE